VVGSLDVGGLLVLARATTTGSLGVAGMVASAYGVIPLAAGIVLFKERPAMNQLAGVALLLSALVGVAAPSSPVSRLLLVVIGAALVGLGLVTGTLSGFFGIGMPSLHTLAQILFAPRGLLVLSPVLILGAVGTVLLFQRGRRAEALVQLADALGISGGNKEVQRL